MPDIPLNLCQLTLDGFLLLVKQEMNSGKGLTESYLAVEEKHVTMFGKNRYAGFTTFQRTWYNKK